MTKSNQLDIHPSRKVWQALFAYYFGNSCYTPLQDMGGYNSDVFEYKPYYWDDTPNEYNLYRKLSGFKLAWYKYPLRSPRCNMEITDEQFADIMIDCYNNFSEYSGWKITDGTGNKWWENDNK